MKNIILLFFLGAVLASCAPSAKDATHPDTRAIDEARQRRISELETQIDVQRHTTDRWQLTSVGLCVGCVALLIVGTSLGAKTRHDAALS